MDTEEKTTPARPVKRKQDKMIESEKDVIVTKMPIRQKRPLSQSQLEQLAKNRVKALETLTAQRRAKAELKAQRMEEETQVRETVELKKLDASPKVKQIDIDVANLKAELENLRRSVRPNNPLTGNDLLDKLFFPK
jgi:hypothetical protein